MSWKKVARLAGRFAPVLGRVLAGPGGQVAGEIVAAALGVEAKPEKVLEAIEQQADADHVLRTIELQNHARLTELALLHEQAIVAQAVQATNSVNATMRAEMKAEHWFYRSWRPAYGWLIGLCFGAIIFNALALVWIRPHVLPVLINFINSTVVLWSFAFGVLGVYVHKRSADKQLLAGISPPPSATVREQLEKLF